MTKKIFISHSSQDKPLVDALVNILLDNGCQIERDVIYCSSIEGMKTLPGDPDFIRDLKDKLQDAKLIILLLSPNYYDSQYCLAELGATWMLDTPTFPIVVPPLKIGEIKGILQVMQVGSIDDETHLERLRDAATSACGIPNLNSDNWLKRRVAFTDQLPAILSSLPVPSKISPDELKRAQERAEVYKQERDEANSEIERLKVLISELEKLKDHVEVAKVKFELLSEHEKFDDLRWEVIVKLRELPKVVQKILYYDQNEEPYKTEDEEEGEDALSAVRQGYLRKVAYTKYRIVTDRPDVEAAQRAITKLSNFLDDATNEFRKSFRDKHGYSPSIQNELFWDKYIFAELDWS